VTTGSATPALVSVAPPQEGVARLTLRRPERKNALSIALRDELTAALGALAGDEGVKAVIVTGAGDTFAAGFDLAEFRRLGRRVRRPPLGLADPSAPIGFTALVAAVNGPALAGFDLAVLCDLRVAAPSPLRPRQQAFGDVVARRR
jgi:enoyl-CoA hydratase